MVHLSDETLSELLDGSAVEAAEEHLASCPSCRKELEVMEELREQLRNLPQLEAPAHLWSGVEARLPVGSPRWRTGGPTRFVLQAAAMAAVFVLGLGLGRGTTPDASSTADPAPESDLVSGQPASGASSVEEALARVRQEGAEYDAALRRLERVAQRNGAPVPQIAEERLAALNVLVEATRTALVSDPADPVLNSYLFAALDERETLMREIYNGDGEPGSNGPNSEVMWR